MVNVQTLHRTHRVPPLTPLRLSRRNTPNEIHSVLNWILTFFKNPSIRLAQPVSRWLPTSAGFRKVLNGVQNVLSYWLRQLHVIRHLGRGYLSWLFVACKRHLGQIKCTKLLPENAVEPEVLLSKLIRLCKKNCITQHLFAK